MLNSSPWSIGRTLLTVTLIAALGMSFLGSSSLALDLGEPLEEVEKLESKLKSLTEQDIADKDTSIARRCDVTNAPQSGGEQCRQERTPHQSVILTLLMIPRPPPGYCVENCPI